MATTLLVFFLLGCRGAESIEGVSLTVDAQRDSWNGGQVVQTANYRIYTTVRDPMLNQYLPGFMEAAHGNYVSLTHLLPADSPQPLDMYVLGTKDEWADLTRHRLGDQAKLYLQLDAGGYCLNGVCVLWNIGPIPTLAVASHEGLHQFLWGRLKDRIPIWAEEGLCTVAEGIDLYNNTVLFTPEKNVHRYADLRKAIIQSYWVGLDDLLQMNGADAISRKPGQSTGYYGQLWSLILYIRSLGEYRSGFHQMLQDAQDGKLYETIGMTADDINPMRQNPESFSQQLSISAFRHYISKDMETFEEGWREFAYQLVDIPSK